MFNNVLIALAGVEGDAFYFDTCGYPKSILTPSSAVKCHPAEVETLQRVTACGALVSEIIKYKYPSGLYTDAIKYTVTQILDEYYYDVVQCERDIVPSTEFYSLTELETIFSTHLKRLEFLYFFLVYVVQKCHGVAILDWLVKSIVGDPTVRQIVLRLVQSLTLVFINQVRSWMVQGEIYDPLKEFMIITKESCNGEKKEQYKLIDSSPTFISKEIQRLIYEIGTLISSFNGIKGKGGLNDNDWETFVNESLSNFPQILISDSFKVVMIVEDIHKNLSKNISNFLRENGLSACLSILRDSFLGGRGDLIMSLHDSLTFLRFEEATDTVAMLDELDHDCFKIIPHGENCGLDYEMMLWYVVSKELSIFLKSDDVRCVELKKRLSDTLKLICFL